MNTITIPKNTTKKLIKKLKAKKSQTKKGGGKIKQAIIEEEDTLMEKFKNVYSDVFTELKCTLTNPTYLLMD